MQLTVGELRGWFRTLRRITGDLVLPGRWRRQTEVTVNRSLILITRAGRRLWLKTKLRRLPRKILTVEMGRSRLSFINPVLSTRTVL